MNLKEHVSNWVNCERCFLWKQRSRTVFARGSIPCEIALVGEAPGESEDTVGQPFIGPAGHLLDQMLDASAPETVTKCFMNLVLCIPKDSSGEKMGEPPDEAVKACSPRLSEFLRICDGDSESIKLLVCVGGCARDWLDQKMKHCVKLHRQLPQVAIDHPSFILRQNEIQGRLLIRRNVVLLRDAVSRIF